MPRARDKNKFRRGKEQRYNRSAVNVSRQQPRSSVTISLFPFMLIFCAFGFFAGTLIFKDTISSLVNQLTQITITMPHISLPHSTISIPTIHFTAPRIQLPSVSMPSFPIYLILTSIVSFLTNSTTTLFQTLTNYLQMFGSFVLYVVSYVITEIQIVLQMLSFFLISGIRVLLTIGILITQTTHIILQIGNMFILKTITFMNPIPFQSEIIRFETSVLATIMNAILTLVITLAHGLFVVIQFIVSIILSIYATIANFFHAVGTSMVNTKHASDRQVQSWIDSVRPYHTFATNSMKQTLSDLGTSFTEFQKLTQGLVTEYNKNSQNLAKQ